VESVVPCFAPHAPFARLLQVLLMWRNVIHRPSKELAE
jgi:hypothetical protein